MPGLNPRNSEPRFAWLAGFKPKVFAIVLAGGLTGVWAISRLTSPPKDVARVALAGRPDVEMQGSMPQPSVDSALTMPVEAPTAGTTRGGAIEDTSSAGSGAGSAAAAAVPTSDGAPTPPAAEGGAALTAKALDAGSRFNGTPSGNGGTSASSGIDSRDARASLASARGAAAIGAGARRGTLASLGGRTVASSRGVSSRGQAFSAGHGSFGAHFAGSGATGTDVSAARAGGTLQGENAGAAVVPLSAAPNPGQTKDTKNLPTPQKPEDKSKDSNGMGGDAGATPNDAAPDDRCFANKKTTRCGAYTCAARESKDIAAELLKLQDDTVGELKSLVDQVTAEVTDAKRDETNLRRDIKAAIPGLACSLRSPYYKPKDLGCACLVKNANDAKTALDEIVAKLTAQETELKAIREGLGASGSPADLKAWRKRATDAIDQEGKIEKLMDAQRRKAAQARNACEVPDKMWRHNPRGTRYPDLWAANPGKDHEKKFLALAKQDVDVQNGVLKEKGWSDKSWCERHEVACPKPQLGSARKKVEEHTNNVNNWASEIPDPSIKSKANDASTFLGSAENLLASPANETSKNDTNGTFDLNQAAFASAAETKAWEALRDGECSKTHGASTGR